MVGGETAEEVSQDSTSYNLTPFAAFAADQVPDRPNRVEPRARKRRPKVYQLLTSPRHQMVVSPSRALK